MQYNIFKVLTLIVLSISVSGCFGPTNTAEEVVSSYLESVKKDDYKSVSLLLTEKHQAEMETKKIACIGSTKELAKEVASWANKYKKKNKKCLAEIDKDEVKEKELKYKTYLKDNNKEGLAQLMGTCIKNKELADLSAEIILAATKRDRTKVKKLEKEIMLMTIKTEVIPNLSPESIVQCEKKVLIPKDMQKLNDGKILTVSTQNDAQKTITVEFTFQRYKQKANFLVYLQDNTWRIESINFLEVDNNLLGTFRCQEFTEDFSIRVKKGNKLDFYFDGNRFEYKTKLITPNEILVEFKKDKTETFRKTAEGTFIYNNTPCKPTF